MARQAATLFALCVLLLALLEADANPGRKLKQLVTGTGASTAAASATADMINKAIDNKATVKKGGSAANLAVNPKPQPKSPPKTDKGTAYIDAPEASQAKTSAGINKAASGDKSAIKSSPAVTGSTVTKAIAAAPKGTQGAGQASGAAQTAQAATSSAIDQKVSTASAPANRGL